MTPAFASCAGLRVSAPTLRRGALCSRPLRARASRACGPPAAGARMQAGPTGSIDFADVDLAAGDKLAGLVFTPEEPGGPVVRDETRCAGVGFTPEQAAALNRHINVEYTAMYAYDALWAYFDRDAVALPGFAKHFAEQSAEEREHAGEFMEYQNKRGGKVVLFPLAVPEMTFQQSDATSDAIYAMDLALQLEKFVMIKLQELHSVAEGAGDAAMTQFVEGYLAHQVDAIKEAADKVAQLKRVGTGHGVYHIDRVLLGAPASGHC